MFDVEDFLAAPRTLGAPLGRRPFKLLTNVLCRKHHRFLPPNIPELVIPADQEARRLMWEMFEDVEAVGGDTALRALRAVIEQPYVRSASPPLPTGGRDYAFAAAVDIPGSAPLVPFVNVRVVREPVSRGSVLDGIRCRIYDGDAREAIRTELASAYRESESRKSLLQNRERALWLRGKGAVGTPPRWDVELEAIASTYGFRMDIVGAPDDNIRGAATAVRGRSPSFAVIWDHDGRATECVGRLGLTPGDVECEFVYGDWDHAVSEYQALLARRRGTPRPVRSDPKTVIAAVDEAQGHPDLIILDAARRSAERSVFRRPSDVRTALETLAQVIADGAIRASGGLAGALAAGPFRYAAGVSETAHTRFRSSYERRYDGGTVLLAPHLKLGAGSAEFCLRIYWYVDVSRGRVVVGHIGEHLPDAGS